MHSVVVDGYHPLATLKNFSMNWDMTHPTSVHLRNKSEHLSTFVNYEGHPSELREA